MSMYEIFGEMESAEEINKTAEGLRHEGDIENIYVLAKENGIPEELAKAYIDGEIPFLVDDCIAACGKIDVELQQAKEKYGETAVCIADYIKARSEDERFAKCVRRKGKNLMEILKKMEDTARKQVKARKGLQVACIPPSQGFRMIRDYYQEGMGQ